MHVRATVSDSSLVLKDIEKGRATLGLVGQKTENPNLEFRPIGSDSLVLIVNSKHPSARPKNHLAQGPEKREAHHPRARVGSRCALEKGLARAGTSLAALNVTLELGSNAAIKDAVQRGLGVAFLSQLAVRRELELGRAAIDRRQGPRSRTGFLPCLRPPPPAASHRRRIPPFPRNASHSMPADHDRGVP